MKDREDKVQEIYDFQKQYDDKDFNTLKAMVNSSRSEYEDPLPSMQPFLANILGSKIKSTEIPTSMTDSDNTTSTKGNVKSFIEIENHFNSKRNAEKLESQGDAFESLNSAKVKDFFQSNFVFLCFFTNIFLLCQNAYTLVVKGLKAYEAITAQNKEEGSLLDLGDHTVLNIRYTIFITSVFVLEIIFFWFILECKEENTVSETF